MRITIDDVVMKKEEDIYDYLTKGIVPSEDDKEKLLKEVVYKSLVDELDDPIRTEAIVRLVYDNMKRNTVVAAAAITGAFVLGLIIGVAK
jgi:hypothetical protein